MLDVDDLSNGGPETTTFKISPNGTYKYAVYDYSCRSIHLDQLQRSGCKVQVYSGNSLIQTLNVPTTGYGRWWHVFTIENGVLSVVNQIIDIEPSV